MASDPVKKAHDIREAVAQDVAANTVRGISMLVAAQTLSLDDAIDAFRMGSERAIKFVRAKAEEQRDESDPSTDL